MLFEWFIIFMINTLWKIQSLISCVCKISKNNVLKWDVTDLSIILTKFGVYWNVSNYSLFFMGNCNCNLYRFSLLEGRLFCIEWCRNIWYEKLIQWVIFTWYGGYICEKIKIFHRLYNYTTLYQVFLACTYLLLCSREYQSCEKCNLVNFAQSFK